jgi:hypothetical protein
MVVGQKKQKFSIKMRKIVSILQRFDNFAHELGKIR